MTARIHATLPAPSLRKLYSALVDAMNAVLSVVRRIDTWLEARERAAADRDALARMSDRELHDIGLDRAGVNYVAYRARLHDDPY